MPNEFMQAAIEYERKGFSVIPLKPKDKIPLVIEWKQYQIERADREQIGIWWRQWPTANIGLVMGDISGYDGVDIDSDAARAEFKSMCAEHDLDNAPIATTGKGWHLYFAHTKGLGNKVGVNNKPGIDFRSDGGYLVAPPSVHPSGKVYEWIRPLNGIGPPLPPGFLKVITAPAPTTEGYRQRFDTAATLAGIPEGGRDEAIFKLAAKLRGADVPYEIAIELCEQAASNCIPPFREARRKVDQAYKYNPGHSSQAPQQESFWPQPLNAQQLIDLPPDLTRWVWDQCLPLRSTSALVAKSYTGKSTFAASLALAVARGIDFLGRPTQLGTVLYVYLDGPLDELKENFINIGLTGSDQVLSYAGRKPDRVLDWCKEMCLSYQVKLLIVDTAQKFFGFKEDKYEEKINKMQPMLDLVNEFNFHAMFTYHAAKNSTNTISALGSVASEANARVSLYLRKKEETEYRVFDTDQNSGKKFESIVLSNPKDGFLKREGTLYEIEIRQLRGMVINELKETPGLIEDEIRQRLNTRGQILSITLRQLREENQIERTGKGRRGDPFHYFPSGSLIKEPAKIIDIFKDK